MKATGKRLCRFSEKNEAVFFLTYHLLIAEVTEQSWNSYLYDFFYMSFPIQKCINVRLKQVQNGWIRKIVRPRKIILHRKYAKEMFH